MPTAVIERVDRRVLAEPPRKKWNRAECEVLEAYGVWDQQHLELIGGELIDKVGKKRPHVITLTLVQAWLVRVFREQFVNPEAPIDVAPEENALNEPEPDLIVLARPQDEIRTGNPQPADLRLGVEISDTTLAFDMKVKAPLYARAGIVEYWIVDIAGRRVIVHRDPRSGAYQSVEAYAEHEAVHPLASPQNGLAVRDAFPV